MRIFQETLRNGTVIGEWEFDERGGRFRNAQSSRWRPAISTLDELELRIHNPGSIMREVDLDLSLDEGL